VSFIDLHTNVSLGHTKIVGLGGEKLWLCPTLGGDKLDISGNGNHGTYNGGMGTVADTSNGGTRAYLLDGLDDYIDCGSASTIHSNSVFTYSIWIKASSNTGTTVGVFGAYDHTTGDRGALFAVGTNFSNKGAFYYQSVGSTYNSSQLLQSTVNVVDGTWHHIVCVFDGVNGRALFYRDGTLAGNTASSVPSTVNQSADFLVGRGAALNFSGVVDDARIFDRALSTSEIKHLASKRGVLGTPRNPVIRKRRIFYAPTAPPTTTAKAVVLKKPNPSYATGYAKNASESANPNLWKGLVGAWMPSFGVTGNTLKDVSGNGNDGTLTNMDAATDWVTTSKGLALDFDGVNDYVSVDQSSLASIRGGSEFSVSFLVKKSASYKDASIGAWHHTSRNGFFVEWYIDGNLYFGNSNGGSNNNVASLNWSIDFQHIVCVFNGKETTNAAKGKIYANGKSLNISSAGLNTTTVSNYAVDFTIGRLTDYPLLTTGNITNVTLYNRALSPSEIKQLYLNPAAPFEMKDTFAAYKDPLPPVRGLFRLP
jgi:hypothetical protein